MKHTLTVVTALVLAAFSAAQESKEDQILKKLTELQKSLDDIRSSFRGEIDAIKRDAEDNRRDINTLKTEIANLKSQAPAKTSDPVTVPHQDYANINSLTQKGTLKIFNWRAEPYNIVINDQPYRINGYQAAVLDVPAGSFTYKVCGINPESVTRTVLPNDSFNIIINANQTVSQISKIPPGSYGGCQ